MAEAVRRREAEDGQEHHFHCIRPLWFLILQAVQRSWWTVAEHIVAAAKEQEVDISSPFARSAAIIKSDILFAPASRLSHL